MSVKDAPPPSASELKGDRYGWGVLSIRRPLAKTPRKLDPLIQPLISALSKETREEEQELILKAFEIAEKHHRGQVRKSGEPYITHPIAVATILLDLGVTGKTLVAALLHDVLEDTDYTLKQLIANFGEEVGLLVDGVTKLDKLSFGDSAQAETVRKMIVAMSRDIRVLIVKLADRLHNARTWQYVSRENSRIKAKETIEIYAPLAHRLGMSAVKTELEDLSFAVLQPKVYEELVRLVGERAPERQRSIASFKKQVLQELDAVKISGIVTGRSKHFYSIYQKMVKNDKDFDYIYDLIGLRVLVNSVNDCYAVLGAIHARWHPIPGRFKDYIAMPKYNLYQSLHTTVIGPDGKPVEIQIRTPGMHRQAEYGVAAHWKYKNKRRRGEGKHRGKEYLHRTQKMPTGPQNASWLKSLVDWQQETQDSEEFLEALRHEMNTDEVYVFTPQGEVITLPAEATPVDFAYAVHTEVGHRTIGARVNGRQTPLNSQLQQGDAVEIITSKAENATPSQDWLKFIKSARAKSKIRQYFSKERREEALERGKERLQAVLRKQHLPVQELMNDRTLKLAAREMNLVEAAAVYAAIGSGHISAEVVTERLLALTSPKGIVPEQAPEARLNLVVKPDLETAHKASDVGVVVAGAGDVLVKLARCCTPVPPELIAGFVTQGSGISVHRKSCINFKNLESASERIVNVSWSPTRDSMFLAEIQVEALDRKNLLSDVSRILADNHINILSARVHTSSDRVAISRFAFEIADPGQLNSVLQAVRSIDGVYDVYRANHEL